VGLSLENRLGVIVSMASQIIYVFAGVISCRAGVHYVRALSINLYWVA